MSARKALGYFLLLVFLTGYSVAVVSLADLLGLAGWGWQLLYYATSGLVWIYPAVKILDWSHKADRCRL